LAGGAGRLELDGRIEALSDICFELQPGDVLGVVGRNGAGKSTLLALVGGVGEPDSGRVELEGRIGALLDLGVGGHPDLTGRDNVIVSGIIAGLSKKQVLSKMDEIIGFAELEDFVDSPLRTYSTGMQMRLAFSVIVHADPEVLLVDEVLSVGDIAFQQKCLARIRKLREEGCIVLLASHDLPQVVEICDRALWLEAGRQMLIGEPADVVDAFRDQTSLETRARTPEQVTEGVGGMQSDLVLNENRLGSQEVKISAVHIQDLEGTEISDIVGGQSMKVILNYEATEAVDGGIFGVSISSAEGAVCLEMSTSGIGDANGALSGKGSVALELFDVDLRPGCYFVDVGIYEREWRYAYDYHWHVYPVQVLATETRKEHRSVAHRWSVLD
jgi:lipopolysaccharide transport system ATP-binding protein